MSNPTEHPNYTKQLQMEEDMRAAGSRRFKAQIEAAREGARESETVYGADLLGASIVSVSGGIQALLDHAKSGAAGRRHQAVMYLAMVSPDVAAFIATKGVIDGVTARIRLQNCAMRIASMIEDEVRFTYFEGGEQTDPADGTTHSLKALFKTLKRNLDKQTSNYDHKRTVLIHSMTKVGLQWEAWPKADKLHLGIKLIEIVMEKTGIVEVHTTVKRNKTELYLEATEKTLEWINAKSGFREALCAVYQPMIMPPVDWTSPVGGGYLSNCHPKLKLVKTRNKAYMEELRSTNLSLVYASLNGLQKTAWKINPQVYAVMAEAWDASTSVLGGLPSRENAAKPPKPRDIETNKEARKAWRRAASEIMKGNLKLGSKRLQVSNTLSTAKKLLGEEALYFPYTLDFRGRIYAVPIGLNPQGHDIAKGLLTFAQGKALGTQQAADWLAVHGANLFGFDKVSLEDRATWVETNLENILGSAKAPLDHHWWTTADKPWQFLAFCFEWAAYREQGLSFESALPIALDGSCNGLQHFSAMLRDAVGGEATNLTPSPKPQDIYQRVADRVLEMLTGEVSTNPLAAQWLAFGITRKITKRPVMVVPYGGTRHSARDYILEYAQEQLETGKANPFGDDRALFMACTYLSGIVWEAISETVVAARDAMGWLQQTSQVVSREEKPIVWTAPSGFPVQQLYPEMKSRTVDTKLAGKVVKLNLQEPAVKTEGGLTPSGKPQTIQAWNLDKRRQAQGISPNFVHSLDAAALTFTVDACLACGIESFAMIHDSYGTHAADTDTLRECLRQSFCQMYQMDVLKMFRDEVQQGLPDGVELPPLPPKGSLDINLVLQSDFFFA